MATPEAPPRSNTFLKLFGTPTLLWRVLNSVGYVEPPRYFWQEVAAKGQPWYDVRVTIPARADNPQWQGSSIESDKQSPWEGAQVVAFEVLSEICQEFGDELVIGPAGSFPRIDPS
jgi:hypothetical protein